MTPTQETLRLPLKLHSYLMESDPYPRNPAPTVEIAYLPDDRRFLPKKLCTYRVASPFAASEDDNFALFV